MLSNVRNSIWIYLTDGINFLGDLDILITFRHIGMINNYLCFLRNSNKFRDFCRDSRLKITLHNHFLEKNKIDEKCIQTVISSTCMLYKELTSVFTTP